jgi:hypothetical protein
MLVRGTVVALALAECLGPLFLVAGCSSDGPSGGSGSSSGQTGTTSGSSSGQAGTTSGSSSGQTGTTSGSSSGQTGTTSGSSSGQTGPDASPDETGPLDADGGCSMYPGVTVTSADAGAQSPTWSCIEANCSTQLASCAADCKCNELILKALFASHDLASANAAFTSALGSGGPPADAILVGVCLQLHQSDCPMWGSTSADAAAGD